MRDFLKHTFATLLGLFIFLGLSVGSLLLLIIVISSASRDTGPIVKDRSMLVFDLSQTITDAPPTSSTTEVLNGALSGTETNSMTLKTVLDSIDAAAKDKRIIGLYLYGGSGANNSGYATLREVRTAIERFKATGKKVYAYDVDWQERDYYLGSVADTIAINPIGTMEFNGLSAEGVFFAEALQKFGIGVQVTRVGKYKSAVEPFLRSDRSPADRQQTQRWLNDLWGELLASTGKARNMKPAQLQAIADSTGFLTATEARDRKLIDRVAYPDELVSELKKLTGEEKENQSFRQISLKNYVRVAEDRTNDRSSSNQIAIVYVDGEIVNGLGSGGNVGGDRIARQLRELRMNNNVKAVVLRVNSPGGSATASDIIQREAILLRKTKPLIVSMGNVAASGGYWVATYSDRIFAQPNTITGSIGVFGRILNFQKLANQNGIKWDAVKTAKFADSQTVSRPKTPEELALIQRSVNQIYDQFLDKVADSRKLERSKVSDLAQGRVWSGLQAKSLGLVDEIGGLEDAIREAAKRAKLGDDWQVEEYPKTRTLEERILERLIGARLKSSEARADDLITQEFKRFQNELNALRTGNDPQNLYLRLPVDFTIR